MNDTYCLNTMKRIFLFTILIVLTNYMGFSKGCLIPTDTSQADFLKAYKFVLYGSYVDYRFTGTTLDSILFPNYGEFSPYWVTSGPDKGKFVYPEDVSSNYASVTSTPYDTYNWQGGENLSVQFKLNTQNIALFKSKFKKDNNSISWNYTYYKNMFDSYIFNNMYYYVNEDDMDTMGISGNAQMLIIPSFSFNGTENKTYIDSIMKRFTHIKAQLDAFLARGGVIYTEGNAVYVIEKLGYLPKGAVDYSKVIPADPVTNLVPIDFVNSSNPISFTQNATGDFLFANSIPTVNTNGAEIIANVKGKNVPAVFLLQGAKANNGKIICNLGLPVVGGMNDIKKSTGSPGARQLQWVLNAITYAFSKNIDVTRSIFNNLPNGITAGKNAIAYDDRDTFEIRVLVRNLSAQNIDSLNITEYFRDFFQFVDVTDNTIQYSINGSTLILQNISLPAKSEKTITYRLSTPPNTDPIHDKVNNYISWANYIYESFGVIVYKDITGLNIFYKYRDYTDVMFSAKIVADGDLNWKNFITLNYQPFKVFTIIENKERTPAMNTKYTQYVPKDAPFYWTDPKINIPILRTPGGKFVNVLKGSDDQNNPEFDMDQDGHPDIWLDTASIYPKGYTIEEDSVYWLNPWEHLRTGDTTYYEDINHDGIRPRDLDGDGIVDVESPGDKIRVWKITWDIGKVNGYQFFDPYCYFEIWVDPPDLVALSAGVGYVNGKCSAQPGMFYPYTKDISKADLQDTSWTHWMERGADGNVIWKQLIYQKIQNYEGFTFIDTLKENYHLKPSDICVGTVPQPHREFIAVLSLGGEEIDMNHFIPTKSLYSNIKYKTIFNENKETAYPIRSTYTYWTPLPNPLQFEYLSNNFLITDINTNETLKFLPKYGKVNLTFDVDASTEYSYYWIRNAGHDVDYNDPSLKTEGIDKLGDGVFGYLDYDLPKGLGGYSITLPKKADGTYDVDKIVEVDGHKFEKWLENPNTGDNVRIVEDLYQYHILIPQLLIPPALADKNGDGIDDWIDDRGDRFHSETGYLHDGFMLGDGESYPAGTPNVYPHNDKGMAGQVDSGWSAGADNVYGDDNFQIPGMTHFKFHAIYEGQGKEGCVDISKGGWLVVEEIFGGSPWVIFSHVISAFAQGVDYRINSAVTPSVVKYGIDTTYIKHVIWDNDEPHNFDSNFDPYNVSFGYGETTISTYIGGKDPCGLILPADNMPAIIDPGFDHKNLTLIPSADKTNPDLKDYPKNVSGTFIEVRLEVMNGTQDNWINTSITPILPPELKNSQVVMSYVSYPRPLVPAWVDGNGKVIYGGDEFGSFRTGFRFNQPEGEVLVKLGNTLNMLQPSRRAYYMFLISVDEALPKGVYNIDFKIDGKKIHYDGKVNGNISYEVPSAKFSVTWKNSAGNVAAYQKIVVGPGKLNDIKTQMTSNFSGLQDAKWSTQDINPTNFDTLPNKLPAAYDTKTGIETINMSQFSTFPNLQNNALYILEKGKTNSYNSSDQAFDITKTETLDYNFAPFGDKQVGVGRLNVTTTGPIINAYKHIIRVNGDSATELKPLLFFRGVEKDIEVQFEVTNSGNDVGENTTLNISSGPYFVVKPDTLPPNITSLNNIVSASLGLVEPGQTKKFSVHYGANNKSCQYIYDTSAIVPTVDLSYKGNAQLQGTKGIGKYLFTSPDRNILLAPAYDQAITELKSSLDPLEHGKTTTLSVNLKNGLLPVKGSRLQLFAIIENRDTVLLADKIIDSMDILSSINLGFNYLIPDSVNYIEFFAVIDANDRLNEFCVNNNIRSLQVPFEGPNWIIDVTVYPNPLHYNTSFSYILPREMNDLSIIVYTTDGREMTRINNCPVSLGQHIIRWEAWEFPKGSYFYNITGHNASGGIEKYTGKLIRD